ncbi:hypothetical protein E4U09_007278 [Claviceps aff. purpurea]|uniref:Uncharacterized protein n=1 Tax=Claviceps aff. purpurea TaxID=1967640 RepID=A0A9P7U2X7_9HYPO|nr:hypothetical protein E4U09_007278 [Claviceps aff. purpurea]
MCKLDAIPAKFGCTIQTRKGADCGKTTCKHSTNYRPPPKAAPPPKGAKRAPKPGGTGKTMAELKKHVAEMKAKEEGK